MTETIKTKYRLKRIALNYEQKAEEWDYIRESYEKAGLSISVTNKWKNAVAKREYYVELSNYTWRTQKEPTESIKKKIWQDALFYAKINNKRWFNPN